MVSVYLSVRAICKHCPDRQTNTTVVLFSVTIITQLTGGGQQGVASTGEGGTGGEGQHGPGGARVKKDRARGGATRAKGGHGRGRTGRGEARQVHYAPGSH